MANTLLKKLGAGPLPENPFKQQRASDKVLAQELMGMFDMMRADRGIHDTHYQQIAQVILPNSRGFNTTETAGKKLNDRVFDNTPVWANEQLANALVSNLVNPFQRWFQFRMDRKELNDDPDVQQCQALVCCLDSAHDSIWYAGRGENYATCTDYTLRSRPACNG